MCNDAKLIIDSFAAIKHKLAGSIVHTDHGADYASKSYQNMLCKYHATNQCRELKIRLITVTLNFDSVSLKLN